MGQRPVWKSSPAIGAGIIPNGGFHETRLRALDPFWIFGLGSNSSPRYGLNTGK
jgi:hypothetical protein